MAGVAGQTVGRRGGMLRRERGLSQAALGRALSSDRQQSWVSGIEGDKFRPSYEEARELASILQVSVAWLMYGEEDAGESEFVSRMRVLAESGALSPRRQREVLRIAEVMAEEDRQVGDDDAAIRQFLADPVRQREFEEWRRAAGESRQERAQ